VKDILRATATHVIVKFSSPFDLTLCSTTVHSDSDTQWAT